MKLHSKNLTFLHFLISNAKFIKEKNYSSTQRVYPFLKGGRLTLISNAKLKLGSQRFVSTLIRLFTIQH